MTPIPQPLLVVTDRHQARQPLEDIVAEIVAAGARWIWFRDRDMERTERRELAFRLSGIVQSAGGRLSIGGDVALAAEAGTNAVHVRDASAVTEARRLLGPAALVGMSAHGVTDVENALTAGANYVTLSPIYETTSKPGYGPALGPGGIARAASLGIPVLALGGVTADNLRAVRQKGAAGIAVMGGVMRAESPRDVVAELLQRLGNTAGNPRSLRLAGSTKV